MNLAEAAHLIYTDLVVWFREAIHYVPRLGAALILFGVFVFLSRRISRWTVRGADYFSNNLSLLNLLGSVTRVVTLTVGLFMALGVLGLEKTVSSLLAGAGIVALAIGFAFQDLTANFISGTMIALARPVQVGDVVETNGFTGTVLNIKLRSILLDNGQGQTVEIPSKDVFQKPITNFSRIGQRRIELIAGVSYLDDLTRAQTVAQEAVRALPFALANRPVELHYRQFGDANLQFMLWFWIDPLKTNPAYALSEAIKAVKTAFDREQILFVFAGHTFDLKQRVESHKSQ